MELEVIDLDSKDAGRSISVSLQNCGFAVLKNYSMSSELIQGMYFGWCKWFEHMKIEWIRQGDVAKEKYLRDPATQAGYFSVDEAESAVSSPTKDYKEYFHIFQNTFDQVPEELRYLTRQHFQQAEAFARRVMFHVKWECPKDTFYHDLGSAHTNQWEESDQNLLRILYYPSIRKGKHDESVRAHAHTDVNVITLLPSGTTPGLQVKHNDEWVDVPFGEDYVIVNAGDALAEMTGGFYKSAEHRVQIDPEEDNCARMSMPFFLHARTDARLSNKWVAGDFLQERLGRLGVVVE